MNQIKGMQLHCDQGLQHMHPNMLYSLPQLGALENNIRFEYSFNLILVLWWLDMPWFFYIHRNFSWVMTDNLFMKTKNVEIRHPWPKSILLLYSSSKSVKFCFCAKDLKQFCTFIHHSWCWPLLSDIIRFITRLFRMYIALYDVSLDAGWNFIHATTDIWLGGQISTP